MAGLTRCAPSGRGAAARAAVLVTGAAGGVGRFAIQLAKRGGARDRRGLEPERAEGLAELVAADEVIGELAPKGDRST